VELT